MPRKVFGWIDPSGGTPESSCSVVVTPLDSLQKASEVRAFVHLFQPSASRLNVYTAPSGLKLVLMSLKRDESELRLVIPMLAEARAWVAQLVQHGLASFDVRPFDDAPAYHAVASFTVDRREELESVLNGAVDPGLAATLHDCETLLVHLASSDDSQISAGGTAAHTVYLGLVMPYARPHRQHQGTLDSAQVTVH
jgi:hypothetical protein